MAAKNTSPKGAATAATKTPKKTVEKAATAAPPSVEAKPAAAPTVTLKHLSADMAERHSMPKKDMENLIANLFESMVARLKTGDRVRIGGLGILEVKNRPARMGRNPATGAPIEIKASKKVAFRAAKELKDAI